MMWDSVGVFTDPWDDQDRPHIISPAPIIERAYKRGPNYSLAFLSIDAAPAVGVDGVDCTIITFTLLAACSSFSHRLLLLLLKACRQMEFHNLLSASNRTASSLVRLE
jgi:hypothetical protein